MLHQKYKIFFYSYVSCIFFYAQSKVHSFEQIWKGRVNIIEGKRHELFDANFVSNLCTEIHFLNKFPLYIHTCFALVCAQLVGLEDHSAVKGKNEL